MRLRFELAAVNLEYEEEEEDKEELITQDIEEKLNRFSRPTSKGEF